MVGEKDMEHESERCTRLNMKVECAQYEEKKRLLRRKAKLYMAFGGTFTVIFTVLFILLD